MARIEVVIDGDEVPAVRDLFIEAGGTGYTASRASPGSVTTAATGGLLFNDRASLSMLITVVPEDKVRRWSRASGACSRTSHTAR
ncbi:MAG: hypothetical protein M3179_01265 [Actinomycetota bacterium]|nr:hypothetical protein [Actinomycetota bacterium]